MDRLLMMAEKLDEAGQHDLADRMERLAQAAKLPGESDEDYLRRRREREEELRRRERDYYENEFTDLVARQMLRGVTPGEIARIHGVDAKRVFEAIDRHRRDNPNFDDELVERMDEHERRLREADLSPADYDDEEGLLRTDGREYERGRSDVYERLVGRELDEGMPLPVDMGGIDPGLSGWQGAHVGDPDEWLPILVEDGFLMSPGHAYDIRADRLPLFEMPDPHPIDKGEAPGSSIIFTHPSLLPGGEPMIPPEALEYRGPMKHEPDYDEGEMW